MKSRLDTEVSVHRPGTDAFSSQRNVRPREAHSPPGHRLPMNMGLSPALACETLRAEQTQQRRTLGVVSASGPARPRRSGLMMTEMIVALVLLAICMSVLGPGVGWSLKQRKLGWQRQIAQLELLNQLERLSVVPWEELTGEKLNRLTISPETSRQLPDAVLSGELANVSDPIESRIVRLTLGWKMFNGVQVRPVEFSTVIHRRNRS